MPCPTVRKLAKEAAVRVSVAAVADAGDRLSFFRADLVEDAGWDAAVNGCDYVWHVASPPGSNSPRDPDALIIPARDGALRVLRAAMKAGVERVVMTSSTAASSPPLASADSFTDEALWTDPKEKGLSAYRQSKTIAERAAWYFMPGQGAAPNGHNDCRLRQKPDRQGRGLRAVEGGFTWLAGLRVSVVVRRMPPFESP